MNIEWGLNQKMECVATAAALTFYVRDSKNGATEAGVISFAKCGEAVRFRAMQDGLKKRVNDGCANVKDYASRLATITRFCDHYNSGTDQWNLVQAATVIDRNALFAAIAMKRDKSENAVHAALGNLPDDTIRQFLGDADIAAEYVRRTRKSVDTSAVDALLDAI